MRNSYLKTMVAGLVLVGAMAAPAAAQSSGTSVGANLTFLRDLEETGVGVAIDVAKALSQPAVAVVGEFGLNKFDGYTSTSYLGGVRLYPTMAGSSLKPFVQALVGLEHCCEQNAFAFQVGGGVEVPIGGSANFRAQYDFRRATYDGEGFNENRFGVGVVMPIGQ